MSKKSQGNSGPDLGGAPMFSKAALDANTNAMRRLTQERAEFQFALRFHPWWRRELRDDSPEALAMRQDRQVFIDQTPCPSDCEGCRLMRLQAFIDRRLEVLARCGTRAVDQVDTGCEPVDTMDPTQDQWRKHKAREAWLLFHGDIAQVACPPDCPNCTLMLMAADLRVLVARLSEQVQTLILEQQVRRDLIERETGS
ncbi:TPA: hypothetical protein DEB00_03915 [Candidatus Uhrbacteria bacterium]|nr:hypothetical protein [Candidatus Uhrbacteria bacterium]